MFKSIEHYSGRDPEPERSLDEIWPFSRRAYILMIRNRTKSVLKEGFLNVCGAIEMLAGLEYHHDNIVRLSAALAEGSLAEDSSIFHEAVAYVNRLGQFHYFAASRFVAKAIRNPLAAIPSIERYIVFRQKHSAHRSIDAPRGEPEDAQLLQAMSLSRTWGRMMQLKPGAGNPRWPREVKAGSEEARMIERQQWRDNYITFQLYDASSEKYVNLTIETEHEQICSEAFALLSNLINWDPDHQQLERT
jgi:hypothetical protein